MLWTNILKIFFISVLIDTKQLMLWAGLDETVTAELKGHRKIDLLPFSCPNFPVFALS